MSESEVPGGRERLIRRIRRSILRGPIRPGTDRDRKWIVVNHLVLHFRPIRLPEAALRYTHTWGLGGSSAVLFFMLAGTGLLLMFVYVPSPAAAYDSILNLERQVFFGKLVRNIHYWSANLLIAAVFLHLLRVYITGAYYAPRQFNWVIGLGLFCCVLLSNFTGYLLPWDQLSYWATTIVTGMIGYIPLIGGGLRGVIRGDSEIGSATLVNFYAAHTTVLPLLIVGLMGWHFWRVRKAHGVVIPRAPGEKTESKPKQVLTLPHLLIRELSAALALVALVMVLSLFFNAPLGDAANPGMSPNPAKAPWYFVGLQELLLHFHPLFAVVLIPSLAILGLLFIPYFPYEHDTSGITLMSQRGRRLATIGAALAVVLTPAWIVADEYWLDFAAWLPGLAPSITNGLIPTAILLAGLFGFYGYARGRNGASNNEAIQAIFVLVTVAFTLLTITGVWFRGSGMALVWPWNL